MDKSDILKMVGGGLTAGLLAVGVSGLVDALGGDNHDPNLHPGEICPGIFMVAGECINFIERTHDGKPMTDEEFEIWKSVLKPHIYC